MRKQDYLIQLIQALNPNERRYFKLYCGLQQGEKKFLQLYDRLDGKAEYDAPALCKEMKISPGQLVKQKQYLSQELLSALRNYRESEINSLHNARANGKALIAKRLYAYALEITGKAMARAWELEQFELLLGLLANKYACQFNLGQYGEMRQIADNIQKLSLMLSETSEIDYLDAEAVRIGGLQENTGDFKKLLQHPMLKAKPEKLHSLRAKVGWFRIANNVYRALMPGSKTLLDICKDQKLLFEKNPDLKIFYAYAYFHSLVALAEAHADSKNFTAALVLYEDLERIIDSGEVAASKTRTNSLKAYIYVSRMIIFSELGQFEKVLPEEKKLQPLIGDRIATEQIDAALTLAIAQIHLQRSDLAIDKLNEMQEIDIPERPPHLKTLRPLLMMAQVDLGNYQLIPYLIKSAKSWMKRNEYVEPEYDIFFSLIGAVGNPNKNSTRRKEYARLMQTVKDGKLEGLNKSVYLERWVKSKMTSA